MTMKQSAQQLRPADTRRVDEEPAARPAPEPVFILAPPCTFSWIVCAMLGGHPDAYGLPELHLFRAETVGEWWDLVETGTFAMDHGLLRAVAELYFGEQSDRTVAVARGWVRRRAHLTTGLLFEELVERLKPLVAIEKSPSLVYDAAMMQRALEMFPRARFIHLVSHPRLYSEMVVEALEGTREKPDNPFPFWLVQLASFPDGRATAREDLDPQRSWLALHGNVVQFLASVPEGQQRTVMGEDLMADGGAVLADVAEWLELRVDEDAVEQMQHPERSPYAQLGPPSARLGSDAFLFGGSRRRPEWLVPRSLDGPLEWRHDGLGLAVEVKRMARQFGYT
jgi:Sulfotransferase family